MSHINCHCQTTVNIREFVLPPLCLVIEQKDDGILLHIPTSFTVGNGTGFCTSSAVFYKEAISWLFKGGDAKLSQWKNAAPALGLELLQIGAPTPIGREWSLLPYVDK